MGAYGCDNKVYPTFVYLFFIPEEGAEGDSWSLLSSCSALAESCLTGLGSQECEIKSTDKSWRNSCSTYTGNICFTSRKLLLGVVMTQCVYVCVHVRAYPCLKLFIGEICVYIFQNIEPIRALS